MLADDDLKFCRNYTSAAVGAIVLIALITWITTANKQFGGPDASRAVVIEGHEHGEVHAVVVSDELESKSEVCNRQ